MEIEMKIKGLMLDPLSNMPIIVLVDTKGERALPIWVGFFEANAIALQIENISTPRPMTHDLIKNILYALNAKVKKIVINDLQDNTFYALIYAEVNGRKYIFDSRPSDAIALALRLRTPIYVVEKVISKAKSIEINKDAVDQESLQKWLESLNPEDLGKYKV